MDMDALLGKPPRMTRDVAHLPSLCVPFDATAVDLKEAAYRVLRLPAVADKTFLISIGDRSVGGLTARDQMVGPWQVPCRRRRGDADGLRRLPRRGLRHGRTHAGGVLDAPASGRMAVGEALTNIAAARHREARRRQALGQLDGAAGFSPARTPRLFDTVRAVSDLCQQIGVSIPVGKDSLSMRTAWQVDGADEGRQKQVVSPLSLIVTAFAPVQDARRTLTPQLRLDAGETDLLLIDLGAGRNRLGGSALAQVFDATGSEPPDVDDPAPLPRSSPRSRNWPPPTCCSPTTTVPTAVSSPPSAKWPSPRIAASIDTDLCYDPLINDVDGNGRPNLLGGRSFENADARAVQRGTRRCRADSPRRP
jgi:phosphoribosylformylglycinamidine synthase